MSAAEPISLDPPVNFLAAVSTQIFVVVAIFASMGLLVSKRDRGHPRLGRLEAGLARCDLAVQVGRRRDRRLDRHGAHPDGRRPSAWWPCSTGRPALAAFCLRGRRVAASIAFMIAVVLAVSTVIANQSAVAAIGFAVFFLPQILASLRAGRHLAVPADLDHGLGHGPDRRGRRGLVTPIAWAVSVVALVGFASWRMDRMEF